jgi:hypothetical protein
LPFEELYICPVSQNDACSKFAGATIQEVSILGEQMLGGCVKPATEDFISLNQCLDAINNAFINGKPLSEANFLSKSVSCTPTG